MSHRDKMKIVKKEVRIRKSWGNVNPMSKVIQSGKKYNRDKFKKEWKLICDW